ncbi:MAG: hypothetical protein KJP00_05340 [Bacteroidia bacterium]|nr:hypothetical protein [Bacteroidia bacterium]
MIRYIITLSICAFSALSVSAQELAIHFMDKAFNSNFTNPANLSEYQLNIGLISPHFSFNNSFAYNDVVFAQGNENVLDLDDMLTALDGASNHFINNAAQTLAFGITVKDWNFSIHHGVRNSNEIALPKELLEFVWNGNGQFVGQTINIAPSFNLLAYNELGLGISRAIGKFVVGARFKKINGLANFYSENNILNITTSDVTYDMDIETDYMINGSSFIDFGGFENMDFDTDNLDPADAFKMNKGFGLDLGMSFQVNSKLRLAASVLDIGSIKWEDHAYNYHSQGSYVYTGIDAAESLSGNDDAFDDTFDDIEASLDFTETANSFKTKLPTRAYMSAHYRASHFLGLGALVYGEKRMTTDEFKPSFALNATGYISNSTSFGLTYSVRNDNFSNLGIHAITRLIGFQFFVVADNILPVFDPLNNNSVDVRFGLNLAFLQRMEKLSKKAQERKLKRQAEKTKRKVEKRS